VTSEDSATASSTLAPARVVPTSEVEGAAVESPEAGRRRTVARGAVINSAFLVGIGALNLVKSLIVVGLLTAAEFGVFSIVVLALYLVIAIKSVAVADRYIQQTEADQELAFRRAFTLELIASFAAALCMAGLGGLLALAYGREELLAPALALALVLPGLALQAPVWVFYRRLDFLRQRILLAADPVVALVVTIPLAVAGLGYWSLVIGLVAGAWAAGALALAFSLPLMVSVGLGLMIAQLAVFFGDLAVGLGAAGAIGLAGTFSAYSERVDAVVTQTIYPVICRLQERGDLLLEAFVKSNRLALMWAFPFGIGLTLFVGDLVSFAIGEQWRDAVVLLQVIGVTAAVNHIGFNWGAFYRAAGRTRPIATVTAVALASFLAVAIPLLFAWGLDGFAAGVGVMTLVSLAGRWYYVTRLFPGFEVARHAARAILPTVPAVVVVLGARGVLDGERGGATALAELALYIAVTVVATLIIERSLLREVAGYLRAARPAAAAPGPGAAP
jgi:hypothetical protein